MPVFMPHWPKPIGNRPIHFIDLGLERVLELAERLGNPHKKIKNLIHVAGTNGKASTITFLRRILEESGYSVNVYTSPHLVYFNERILLSGKEISDKVLYDILEECRIVSEDIKLTFFEGVTVGAFLAFSRFTADFTIIETGMGGRLDATNIIDPMINIITSISLDHMEYLGDSLEAIAQEKSGIIKSGSISIIAKQPKEVLEIMEKRAIEVQSRVYRSEVEWRCFRNIKGGICFESDGQSVDYPQPSLRGDHQIINAGNAIACATVLHHRFNYNKIDNEAISRGLSSSHCPARLEFIQNKFSNHCDIFLDGAHNVGGAEVVAKWLGEKKVSMIIGMTKGKDTEGFLKILKNNIDILCAVCVKSEPRSQTALEVQKSALNIGIDCTEQESIEAALDYIINRRSKPTILVCGSLFLAKDLYEISEKQLS